VAGSAAGRPEVLHAKAMAPSRSRAYSARLIPSAANRRADGAHALFKEVQRRSGSTGSELQAHPKSRDHRRDGSGGRGDASRDGDDRNGDVIVIIRRPNVGDRDHHIIKLSPRGRRPDRRHESGDRQVGPIATRSGRRATIELNRPSLQAPQLNAGPWISPSRDPRGRRGGPRRRCIVIHGRARPFAREATSRIQRRRIASASSSGAETYCTAQVPAAARQAVIMASERWRPAEDEPGASRGTFVVAPSRPSHEVLPKLADSPEAVLLFLAAHDRISARSSFIHQRVIRREAMDWGLVNRSTDARSATRWRRCQGLARGRRRLRRAKAALPPVQRRKGWETQRGSSRPRPSPPAIHGGLRNRRRGIRTTGRPAVFQRRRRALIRVIVVAL